MQIQEVQAKSILNKSKIHDYCVNCYTGCGARCIYCYAQLFMRRYSGHEEPWGEFVDVKINAPEVLRKQLARAVRAGRRGTVWLSSVCDPYQPLEKKYELTRRCLVELLAVQFPVNIQTKCALVLRDMDLFRQFREIEVGMTVTTDDERIAALFEPGASSVDERIRTLKEIRASGIRTFAFIGPMLPGNPERLVALLDGAADVVLIDRINYIDQFKRFYRQHGLEAATTDVFFENQKTRLTAELKKRGMEFTVVY